MFFSFSTECLLSPGTGIDFVSHGSGRFCLFFLKIHGKKFLVSDQPIISVKGPAAIASLHDGKATCYTTVKRWWDVSREVERWSSKLQVRKSGFSSCHCDTGIVSILDMMRVFNWKYLAFQNCGRSF